MFGTGKLQQLLPVWFQDHEQNPSNTESPPMVVDAESPRQAEPSTDPESPTHSHDDENNNTMFQRLLSKLPTDQRRRKALYIALAALGMLIFIAAIVKGTWKDKSMKGSKTFQAALTWTSEGGSVQLNGETFHIKGK